MITYVNDVISTLPITYLFYLLFILKRPDFAIGMCSTDIITMILKKLSNNLDKGSFLYTLTRRPVVGSTCDLLSRIPSKVNAPGFPSGHMAITLYFYTMLLFLKYKEDKHTTIMEFCKSHWIDMAIYFIFVCLTGFARIHKGCHTFTQVVAGSIVGILGFYIHNKIQLQFNLFK